MKISFDYYCQNDKDALLRYLLVKASPVMMQVKPSVLVRISKCFRAREFQPYDIFCTHQKMILATLKTDYHIMKNNGKDIQVLFYDRELMQKAIEAPQNKRFLEQQGYSGLTKAEDHLEALSAKFCGEKFPHEIGLFLGYPLKDVIGFMEDYSAGVSVASGRWRIYGDLGESLKAMELFRFAENFGKRIVEHYEDISLCVDKIRSSIISTTAF